MEIINQKSLSEIKEEKEKKKEDIQADVFEVVANLYEEMEGLRSQVLDLKTKVEVLEGGGQ